MKVLGLGEIKNLQVGKLEALTYFARFTELTLSGITTLGLVRLGNTSNPSLAPIVRMTSAL